MSELHCLTGVSRSHLAVQGEYASLLHHDVVAPFLRLREAARQQGFDLAMASGFRSFERQLKIWNAKVEGRRPLLDSDGNLLDPAALEAAELMHAILRWSALPGASRHHWGTDLDVYDAAALLPDQRPALVAAEYQDDGPFAALNEWLTHYLEPFGFFRPYQLDRGGVAPEPWHLSYRPVASRYSGQLKPTLLADLLREQPIALKYCILDSIEEIFERYIQIP